MLLMKVIATVLLLLLAFGSTEGGKVDNGYISDFHSEIYTEEEIQAAIVETLQYFKRVFSGCTLTEITYYGDEKLEGYMEFAQRYGADEVIVLVSSFDVDASGGDGSLSPNETYTDWKWILVRDFGGSWRHVDHGY